MNPERLAILIVSDLIREGCINSPHGGGGKNRKTIQDRVDYGDVVILEESERVKRD